MLSASKAWWEEYFNLKHACINLLVPLPSQDYVHIHKTMHTLYNILWITMPERAQR